MRCVLLLIALALIGCGQPPSSRVVLYCAQDRPFAERVLADFTKATGLTVAAVYDSEANKSVGLYRQLQVEAKRPRCDVHWNNEILTTLMLAKEGILEPYASPVGATYPEAFRAADGTWHGFAARARVLIVNTTRVREADYPRRLLDLTEPRWLDNVAMAKPNHGTTSTQAACLFEVLGPDAAMQFYRGLKANKVKIYAGNKHVAEAVGKGESAIGLTDTDDAIEEVQAGRPVAILFPDSDGGTATAPRMGTLFIPNTVAVVKGGPNPGGAKMLVDYLLSPAIEARLAAGASHQIPLNPAVNIAAPNIAYPNALQPARTAKPMAVDFAKAAAQWEQVQTFLRDEFAR